VFIAALFTVPKLWNQPGCPSTDEQIKKMWYVLTMEYYSSTKQNEIMSFTENGSSIKQNKPESETQILHFFSHMEARCKGGHEHKWGHLLWWEGKINTMGVGRI
jgi:hypothetical protein